MDPEERNKPEDEWLSRIASRLKQPVEAPGLWDRIEGDLLRMQGRSPLERHIKRRRMALQCVAVCAAAVLVICVSLFIFHEAERRVPSLLLEADEAALAENEKAGMERQLARLTPLFLEEMAAREKEASLLAGHVEILDATIENCRKAWQDNRLNRGVQRSLLHGYRKKIELMQDFISAR